MSGEGTESSPYMIYDGSDLRKLAVRVNRGEKFTGKIFKMASDVSIYGEYSYTWEPIGNSEDNYFDGTLYGEDCTVSWSVEQSDGYVGLFGYTGENSYIEGLNVTAGIYGENGYVGGLVGCNNGMLLSCDVEGQILCDSGYCGGLVGSNFGSITDCWAHCNIWGTGVCGGMAGVNYGIISLGSYGVSPSQLYGSIVGGIVGDNFGTVCGDGRLRVTLGDAVANEYLGLGVGINRESGAINQCYFTIESYESLDAPYIGAYAGYNEGGSITDCINETDYPDIGYE